MVRGVEMRLGSAITPRRERPFRRGGHGVAWRVIGSAGPETLDSIGARVWRGHGHSLPHDPSAPMRPRRSTPHRMTQR